MTVFQFRDEPLTYEPLCKVRGCPWKRDPDAHVPWCGHGLAGTHQHWPKRSQGGKEIVAILCAECHNRVDNEGSLYNTVDSGNYTLSDGTRLLVRREIATGRDLLADTDDGSTDEFGGGKRREQPPESPRAINGDVTPSVLPAVLDSDYAAAATALGVPGTLTPKGWIAPASMSVSEWGEIGDVLGKVARGSRFGLGDWLLAGEQRFNETYSQYVEATGLDYQTLVNIASVCRRVPIERRRDNVSFAHHAEVAALAPDEQDMLLDLVEKSERPITVRELRALIRGTEQQEAEPCKHEAKERVLRCVDCKEVLEGNDG